MSAWVYAFNRSSARSAETVAPPKRGAEEPIDLGAQWYMYNTSIVLIFIYLFAYLSVYLY